MARAVNFGRAIAALEFSRSRRDVFFFFCSGVKVLKQHLARANIGTIVVDLGPLKPAQSIARRLWAVGSAGNRIAGARLNEAADFGLGET